MKQIKMFCGRSLSIEENINRWLLDNKDYEVIDIKVFRSDSFIYSLLIYDIKDAVINHPNLTKKRNYNAYNSCSISNTHKL